MIKKIVKFINEEGFEFKFEPVESTLKIVKTRTGYEARYLIYDTNADNPMENQDGMGVFYHWKNNGTFEYNKYCELLGYDTETREQTSKAHPDAVKIDKYEHSGIAYSVSGEGMQCQWDTSSGWTVWYPDNCLIEELKDLKGVARRKKCIEFARQACELFNSWVNGECYCLVKETYTKNKQQIDNDTCGGYFGFEEAFKALQTDI